MFVFTGYLNRVKVDSSNQVEFWAYKYGCLKGGRKGTSPPLGFKNFQLKKVVF